MTESVKVIIMDTLNQQTGKRGEALARKFLVERGYTILETNWRCKFGEVDIIAKNDDILIFLEVRTRYATSTEFAFASINPPKREKFVRAVHLYLSTHNLSDQRWRIDVIAIALHKKSAELIDHVEDAFDW